MHISQLLLPCSLGGEVNGERKVCRAHCCFREYQLGGFDTRVPVLDTYQIDKKEG